MNWTDKITVLNIFNKMIVKIYGQQIVIGTNYIISIEDRR